MPSQALLAYMTGFLFDGSTTVHMKMRTLILAATGALSLGLAQLASAHAVPKQLSPAVDAEVSPSPKEVHLVFSENLEPAFSRIIVANAAGKPVNTTKSMVDAHNKKQMTVALPALLAGRYTVKWSAVAADGHRTHGDYRFKVK